jgi:galactokinase
VNLVQVPGRANLVGEHTDYNEGRSLAFAISLTAEARVVLGGTSIEIDGDLGGPWRAGEPAADPWERVAEAAVSVTNPSPRRLSVRSAVPIGVGLSSSAAFAGALVLGLGARGSLADLATLVRRCEAAAGAEVGLLDPITVLGARENQALLIDFARLSVRDISWPDGLSCTAVFTGERRALAATAYNERRAECRRASELLGGWPQGTLDDVAALADPVLRRRARHVVSEDTRVSAATSALESGDLATLGKIISESHASLRDDFEVSTPLIDGLQRSLDREPGVFGSRLMGGGFGGCVIVAHEPSWRAPSDVKSWALRPAAGALERLGFDR